MDRFLATFFNLEIMGRYAPKILEGMWVTTYLALAIVLSGLALGLVLAVIRTLRIRPLNWLIVFFVDLLRSVPPLVLVVLFYYGLPALNVPLDGLGSTWLALALVLAAFA